tara:strand:+ start:996 stop:1832 length:837 start_codon:yes stop_codon:yes gene_type:complete
MKNLKVKSHAIKENVEYFKRFDYHIEEIKRNGFTIVPDLIDKNNLEHIKSKIYNIYDIQVNEVGGEENLNKIHDQGFVMSLLSYDNFFIDYATGNGCIDLVKYFLGDYFQLFCQNGVINQNLRENDQIINMWHRDLNYLHFTTSKPFGINVFFCIDDFTNENGATYMLPGSHRHEKFPGVEYAEKHKIQMEAKAGSALVFDAMIFHRAGRNISKKDRLTMTNIYTYPFMKQQIILNPNLEDFAKDDEEKMKILGFFNKTVDSVKKFRQIRIARSDKNE